MVTSQVRLVYVLSLLTFCFLISLAFSDSLFFDISTLTRYNKNYFALKVKFVYFQFLHTTYYKIGSSQIQIVNIFSDEIYRGHAGRVRVVRRPVSGDHDGLHRQVGRIARVERNLRRS